LPDKVKVPTTPTAPTTVVSRIIKKGMRGEDVKEMQTKLANKGYLRRNEIDGDFGTVTLGALLAF
jgi:peptidoglycan hydrolase-like protein with peptidoglycan-binding domain